MEGSGRIDVEIGRKTLVDRDSTEIVLLPARYTNVEYQYASHGNFVVDNRSERIHRIDGNWLGISNDEPLERSR